MNSNEIKNLQPVVINGVRCLKKGVKGIDGKYSPAWYSKVTLIDGRDCVTIYAKSCLQPLPTQLGTIQNDTDTMTDYFENDRVRFLNGTPEYAQLLPLCGH